MENFTTRKDKIMTEYEASIILEFIGSNWTNFKILCEEKDIDANCICKKLAKIAEEEWEEEL